MSANTTPSPIVGQAVIVVTEGPAGRFQIRSFESPEGPSTAAGQWADRIVRLVASAVDGSVVDAATDAELARLRRIESAACKVLASGQARYTHLADDGEYAGDLIPAAKMIALAEAVHGATVVDEKPPAASDEYARELDLALFAPMAAQDVAVDLDDDDGCPVGDPDCDLPADSLHEFCEAAGNEERAE